MKGLTTVFSRSKFVVIFLKILNDTFSGTQHFHTEVVLGIHKVLRLIIDTEVYFIHINIQI